MLKNKKLIILIAIIILAIIAISLILNLYPKMKYSLENVTNLLNFSKTSANIHVKSEEKGKETSSITNTYIKDDISYAVSKKDNGEIISESFYDYNTSKLTTIINSSKTITVADTLLKQVDQIPSMNNNFFITSKNAEFEYIGKKEINEKQCIEICLTNKDSNKIVKNYYYIDLEDNRIIKYEIYEGSDENSLDKTGEITYTYSYDTVTDDNIIKFDVSKYPDYEYKD